MSRILKRPMFRTGGTPNEGIMHGLVDRRGYNTGSKAEQYADEYYGMLSKYKPPAPRFPMGQIGLNLVSGQYAGDGLLANIARSAKDPYEQFVQADDATRGIDYQTRMTAAKMGISRAEAERLAMIKAKKDVNNLQKDYSPQRNYRDFFLEYTKPPKDRYSKTIYNMFAPSLAEYASYIQDNAYKTEEGTRFIQQVDGIVPNVIKGGQAQWQYEKMSAGAIYFHPEYKAFVSREPRTDDTPEQLIMYDPYTFQEVRRVNLGK
jgi:hypothetical protein